MKQWLISTGLVVSATVGSGVFALPYVIQKAGWLLSLGYFIIFITVVALAHILYFRTLVARDGKKRLLGLSEEYFGRAGFWFAFLSVVVGLSLGLVGYLILGEQFIQALIPGMPMVVALAVFWFVLSLLIFFSEGNVVPLEIIGVTLLFGVILFIFFSGNPLRLTLQIPLARTANFFLPFGAVLFALAGWTSVEPIFDMEKQTGDTWRWYSLFFVGAAIATVFYWLFSVGVLNNASAVAPDTISGIRSWPLWRRDTLAIMGLLDIGIVAVPLSREIRGALEKDLQWNSLISRFTLILAPLVGVLLGLRDFFIVVSIAGGIFLSMEYILIISIGRRALHISRREKILLDAFVGIFICFAIYEIAGFIVH